MSSDAMFFATRGELRAWLMEHHDRVTELWLGLYKKGSGQPSVTYREAVEEALCFGWIDGLAKGLDGASYRQRLTPRRKRSSWSVTNVQLVGDLTERGLMQPAGLRAFQAREEASTGVDADRRPRSARPKAVAP